MATQTTNYGLAKPEATDNYDVEVHNANMDMIDAELKKGEDHRNDTTAHVTASERDAWNDKADKTEIPTKLPNPSALTISQGYGGNTGTYDGSAAVAVSLPKITISDAEPTGTLADGELWGVYSTS
jgi:hypothetical protein